MEKLTANKLETIVKQLANQCFVRYWLHEITQGKQL